MGHLFPSVFQIHGTKFDDTKDRRDDDHSGHHHAAHDEDREADAGGVEQDEWQHETNEKQEHVPVSYTHLDVYKRQGVYSYARDTAHIGQVSSGIILETGDATDVQSGDFDPTLGMFLLAP